MEFFETIEKRKSISKYKSEEVKEESIDKMIEAAMRAPSWKDKTSFRIIIVKDERLKEQLAEAVSNDDDKAANAIKEAPMAVVVIGKPDESGNIDDKDLYLVDGAIAMEHIILAATAEGLGSLWIGSFEEKLVKGALGIPNDYKVIGFTPIGKANEEKEHNEKKDERDVVFREIYGESYR